MTIKRLAHEPILIQHLEALGIDHRPLTASREFRSLDRQQRLYRLALFAKTLTNDDLLGVRIGRKVVLNGFGPLTYAIVSAPTPLHVLQIILKHLRIFQSYPPNAAVLGRQRGVVILDYRRPVRIDGFASFVPDLFFVSTIQALIHLGASLDGALLELDYAPADPAAYRKLVEIPVRFKARRSRLTMTSEAMNAPLPGKFSSYSRAHGRLAENALAGLMSDNGIPNRVGMMLEKTRTRTPKASDVASNLNLSDRSLRRKLARQGVNFTGLLGEQRARLARSYLLEMPVRDVAELLGYHDSSTFRRAFRRWTNMTPTEFLGKHL